MNRRNQILKELHEILHRYGQMKKLIQSRGHLMPKSLIDRVDQGYEQAAALLEKEGSAIETVNSRCENG